MTRYELLKKLQEKNLLRPLFDTGMVSLTNYNSFTIYECYLFEMKHTKRKMDAISNVCIACKTYEKRVQRAIKSMTE